MKNPVFHSTSIPAALGMAVQMSVTVYVPLFPRRYQHYSSGHVGMVLIWSLLGRICGGHS